MPFSNPLALLGLLGIIPLVIIYLIRPRPREILFSSTQFLREGEARRTAVLSRLITDPLFWIQLLAICSLSLAAAGPYSSGQGPASSHLAVVLDGSASMQASISPAQNIIRPYLDRYEKISIILAKNIPQTVLTEGSPAEARDALQQLQPAAVSADLSSALLQADILLGSSGGDILLVSDFISWIGDDPDVTRNLLQAKGRAGVVFASSYRGGDNLALIEGWNVPGTGYVNHTALIHNYGPARTVPITITGPGGKSSQSALIPQNGDYYLSFTAYPGVNKISLELEDAISWDNQAYVYVPDQAKKNVLYLGDPGPALKALQSLPNVAVMTSGSLPDFDLIVLARNASADGELNRYIDGGRVIYLPSDLESPEYLPVRITGELSGPARLWVRNAAFAGDLHFDEIGIYGYPNAAPRRGATTVVEANGAPILAFWRLGGGMVIYNGLEMDSDFYLRPEYPIFWYQMVNWMTGVPDIEDSNRKTGEIMALGEQSTIQTPSHSLSARTVALDEVGVYRFQGRAVAANMYNPAESSLGRSRDFKEGEFLGVFRDTMVQKDLSPWAMAIAALAIILELLIMRWRRET
ncbi:BatA domain-containing protein [Methanothrix sp.]|uniref:BatA domain-containing protein n=2 Tax=Methanothrix sp. TaxID=90426 RepID=UPI003C7525E2